MLTKAIYIGIVPQEDFFKVYKIRLVYVHPCTAGWFVNFFLPSLGKTNQMERFGFFLLLPKISTFLTNERWTLKKLSKIKVDNYIEGENEFTGIASSFTETPKGFRSIWQKKNQLTN
jgi:hypothetical protein